MASNGNNTTFHELVTEISQDERERMLNKMKKGNTVEQGPSGPLESTNEQIEDLGTQLKRQPFFLQIWYWIMATFTSSTVEQVFNRALVNGMARDVERSSPGLINFKKRVLSTVFYEKLVQLKKAADFFEPYINRYEENPAAFYTLLGYLIVPEVGTEIAHSCDPYQYALKKNVTGEMKGFLIQKMDKTIDEMSNSKKSEMYAAVRGVEWIRQFVKLPLGRVISKFVSSQEGIRECPFAQVKTEFGEFTRILANYVPLTDEAVQALYLFFQKRNMVGFSNDMDSEKIDATEFVNNTSSFNGIVKMFVQTVPMYKLSKVVFENSVFMPDAYGGGESWFQKFRSQWKLMFERRWNNWECDCKKEKLKVKLMQYFHLSDFPLFPFRPWELVPGLTRPFHYGLTLGFIHSFFKNEFPLFNQALAVTSVEGDFAMKENRFEFSESLNLLLKIGDALDLLSGQLSAGGEYGQFFAKLENKDRITNTDEVKIDGNMTEIEEQVADMINDFGKACRSMKNLLGGILSEKITAYYGPLINLMKINGKENKAYRDKVGKAKFCIEHAYEMLQDIEPLDMASVV